VTVAQVRTGHSPLVAAYLHRIARRDSAICPHCHSADETVEHLVLQCPAHDHARRDTWPGDTFTTDPRRLCSYLERIGAMTRLPTGNERERESHEARRAALISVSLALSQTPAFTARPPDMGLVHHAVCMFTPQLSPLLIALTHGGMARLS